MSFAPISMKVAATLTAYRIVKPGTAANTAALAAAATDKLIGITQDDVKDTNQAIPVAVGGLSKLVFNDSCAIGGLVTSDNLGFGVPAVATTAGVNVVGILIGPAVQTTGTIAHVLIQPYQLQIP